MERIDTLIARAAAVKNKRSERYREYTRCIEQAAAELASEARGFREPECDSTYWLDGAEAHLDAIDAGSTTYED